MQSVHDVKLNEIKNRKPTEGTKTRALYDLFMENKGNPIPIDQVKSTIKKDGAQCHGYINSLVNFYDMDIRNVRHGWWALVGMYNPDGSYSDFIADQLK